MLFTSKYDSRVVFYACKCFIRLTKGDYVTSYMGLNNFAVSSELLDTFWCPNESTSSRWEHPVWPDWAIFCPLGNYWKSVATIILSKLPTLPTNSFIFLVKSFLGNFHRHLAIFYWSHWQHPCFMEFANLRQIFVHFTDILNGIK